MFLAHASVTAPVLQVTSLAGEGVSLGSWRYDGVLAGMVGKGHSLAAISAYLEIEPAVVLERVVALGLATPHDGPFTPSKHPRAWPISDFRRLVDCWLDNWKASGSAQAFGRSTSSIYAQARRLGLPRRLRHELKHPTSEAIDRLRQDRGSFQIISRDLFQPLDLTLVKVITCANGDILRIERKPNRDEIKWTADLDLEVSERSWSNQHYKAIATVLGISHRAIRTRLSMLGLPSHERGELVDHYDPVIGKERLRQSGYRWRECRFRKGQFFWSSHFGETASKFAKKSKAYQDAHLAVF